MSLISRPSVWMVLSGLFFITLFTSPGVHATIIPGITDPSVPQFVHNVKVRANRGNWTISTNDGNRAFTFNDGAGNIWDGDGFKYNFTASFDMDTGAFQGGSVSIQGSIAGLGITDKKTFLMSADLVSFGFNAGTNLVGFNTANIVCDPGLGVYCTTSESVFLELDSIFGGDPTARFQTTATAYTSVPLPAAAWLFLSGAGLLGAAVRRRD